MYDILAVTVIDRLRFAIGCPDSHSRNQEDDLVNNICELGR